MCCLYRWWIECPILFLICQLVPQVVRCIQFELLLKTTSLESECMLPCLHLLISSAKEFMCRRKWMGQLTSFLLLLCRLTAIPLQLRHLTEKHYGKSKPLRLSTQIVISFFLIDLFVLQFLMHECPTLIRLSNLIC